MPDMTTTLAPCPKPEWRCFHCDEVFTSPEEAAEHFGESSFDTPACRLAANEGGLVALVRKQDAELDRYRQEDTALIHEVHGLGAKAATEIRRAEEAGYERGLADGRNLPRPSTSDAAIEVVEKRLNAARTLRERLDPDHDAAFWSEQDSVCEALEGTLTELRILKVQQPADNGFAAGVAACVGVVKRHIASGEKQMAETEALWEGKTNRPGEKTYFGLRCILSGLSDVLRDLSNLSPQPDKGLREAVERALSHADDRGMADWPIFRNLREALSTQEKQP